MKIPKFKNEKEEADWLYAHRKEIEAAFRKKNQTETLSVQQIIEREQKEHGTPNHSDH
jgi:hypothetical protein